MGLPRGDSRKTWEGFAERDRIRFVFYVDHPGSSGKSRMDGSKSGNQEAGEEAVVLVQAREDAFETGRVAVGGAEYRGWM